MTREIIPITSEEQWLAERAKDITSTAISALFDLSPYCTTFELYHAHKNGVYVPFKETSHTKAGKAIEEYAAKVAAEKLSDTHGPVASVNSLDFYARIPGERIGSSFDYEVEFEDGHKILLEIKGVNFFGHREKWVDDQAPEHIEIQLQHQLEVIDRYDVGVIAAFTGIYPDDCHLYERERDRDMGEALRQRAAYFWADIDAGREPAANFYRDAEVIGLLYKSASEPPLDKTGDEEFEALVAKYHRANRDAKAFKEDADAAKAEIHLLLGNAGGAYTERYKVGATWTKDSAGKIITADMVGTYTGGRKGYRQCRIKDLMGDGGDDE